VELGVGSMRTCENKFEDFAERDSDQCHFFLIMIFLDLEVQFVGESSRSADGTRQGALNTSQSGRSANSSDEIEVAYHGREF
jgi:hypothetical protein